MMGTLGRDCTNMGGCNIYIPYYVLLDMFGAGGTAATGGGSQASTS